MKIKIDDQRLTAYALGELSGEDLEIIESAILADPELANEVESIKSMGQDLTETLQDEANEKLADHQTTSASESVDISKPKQHRKRSRIFVRISIAALLALAFTGTLLMTSGPLMSRKLNNEFSVTMNLSAGQSKSEDNSLFLEKSEGLMPEGHDAREEAETPVLTKQRVNRKMKSKGMKYGRAGISSRVSTYYTPDADAEFADKDDSSMVIGTITPMQKKVKREAFNREAYDHFVENEFVRVSEDPLSTFSIDVDTASYSNVRRMLHRGYMPPAGAVRLEEMINYFDYDYAPPTDGSAFAANSSVTKCPWAPKHNLLRIGLKGKVIDKQERPKSNLVFLLDVSGSMNNRNKLPLLKEGMKLLVNQLGEKDSVAIVVYAGSSGLVLPSTSCANKKAIIDAIDRLQAGGSTNGGAGINLAYTTAASNFIEGGVNRVILCTDGDFNVGTSSQSALVDLISKKAKEGVFLTVLGFGMGNYQDGRLEKLADKGNGNYGYIDTLNEAKKILVEQISGTLVTIAKDVKIQVEFNPEAVKAYRLLGYENRKLKKEDFNDDKKDAGEIGAGHTVTALYEIIPADSEEELSRPKVDDLRYQPKTSQVLDGANDEMLVIKMRYKKPDGQKSILEELPVGNTVLRWSECDKDFQFASAVAAFGMTLRKSKFAGDIDYDKIIDWAQKAKGQDKFGYREEFIRLVRTAKSISNR